ncbi:glycosyltransferase family 25 protein [Ciceribacter sp. RN22]|uniref:glycosyltransferase family 25 protein n=1 Tax=Ciceribacter sp. RN22 TaxID=2954932 RepID=UPI0020925337|nr:glycosyltransferase family 25 protein [Ciceribacter sp. RN22]MCO6181106.1 glycosyltransferase family 25 protein [Ciceribacter sp. RN22]
MIRTYVISLPGSPRRSQCRRQLDGANIEFSFFDAVNGRTEEIVARYLHLYSDVENRRKFKRPLSCEEIGCYLSHRLLWMKVVRANLPALILEDDFVWHRQTRTFIDSIPEGLLGNAIIKISASRNLRFDGEPLHSFVGHAIREFRVISPHTTGYIIGPQAAERMLMARSRFCRPVDTDMKHVWEHGIAVYGVDPPLVGDDVPLPRSTILAGREATKPTSAVRRFVANLRYQFQFRSSAFRFHLATHGKRDAHRNAAHQ